MVSPCHPFFFVILLLYYYNSFIGVTTYVCFPSPSLLWMNVTNAKTRVASQSCSRTCNANLFCEFVSLFNPWLDSSKPFKYCPTLGRSLPVCPLKPRWVPSHFIYCSNLSCSVFLSSFFYSLLNHIVDERYNNSV